MIFGLKSMYEKLCESTDVKTSLKNENQFFSSLIVIVLLTAVVVSTLMSYFLLHAELYRVVTDGIHLFAFAIGFWIFSKIIKNETVKMYVYSVLLFGMLIFTVSRFYYLIGPAVWVISFLIGVLLLVYSKSTMIILFSIFNAIINIYMWRKLQDFNEWENYYIAQTAIFIMLFIVFIFIFKIAKERQNTI